MEDYKFLFKIVLVGNAGVGKTCLVRRFTQGLFPPGQGATIGVDFMIKTVEVEGEKIKLQIWDTAGQERFRSITQSYYRSAHALILVYDISCQPTFDCLPDWLREIQEYANSKVLKILVGNKTDRDDREIPTQIAELIDQARSKDGSNANKTTADAIGLGNFGTKATQNSCCSGFSSNTGQTNSESSNSRSNT
ncbi:ras-related protein Rab-30 isoform X2 [Zeugodacus cucurbitae]|uniref:ras-related protein Rab-30 isoform X2 n=1 Tax=Zeugodacus cucurbitae TaxID=28588 RepID=UPI000596A1DB|nr:ras-related protein Rab-30 isoform X2 [Zeugodacus cucurbitae]